MKNNILIAPGGSGMAISAIKALKQDKNIRIVSIDSDKLSPGLYLSHKGYIVPAFEDNKFIPAIEKIIKKEKINLIIPALDTILLRFSELKLFFKEKGADVLVSEQETIKITRDKWKTYNKLKDIIPFPKSFIEKDKTDAMFPLFIKPREGSGSQNVYKVDSKEDMDFYYKKIKNPIIQEYLSGKEHTVDCLADNKNKLVLIICRERIETKAGISTKGKIVKNKKIEDMAVKISESLKFYGPFFFQTKEDRNRNPKLTEINARISGTMSLSSFAGPNIHILSAKISRGEKIKKTKIKYGTYVTRYLEDIYLTEQKIKKIHEI
ncbi:MAG: ATP-grasp domain-containing protein [Patescibacteria group bacterium]